MGGAAQEETVSEAIHPDARAGAGGAGNFRDANSFLNDDASSGTLRHARGAANRLLSANAATPMSGGSGKKANPPPKTRPLTKILLTKNDKYVDFKIRVRVVADVKNARGVASTNAQTRVVLTGGLDRYKGPGMYVGADGTVTKVTSKLKIHGSYIIKTKYGSAAKAADPSTYGRGTTRTDKANGDTTLGFHESIHREEFLDYLKNNPFPEFKGKIGMSESDFDDAFQDFRDELQKYHDDLNALGPLVDEVGYKYSKCVADGIC